MSIARNAKSIILFILTTIIILAMSSVSAAALESQIEDIMPTVPLTAAGEATGNMSVTPLSTPINDVYNPGAYWRQVDLIKYEKTSEMFTTNVPGDVVWFSSDPEVVKVTGYTIFSCGVAYLKPGNAKLTLSYTHYVGDMLYNTQIILNITVRSALPDNNTVDFAGGSGTAQDPYLISTKQHLNNITTNTAYLQAHYKLVNDIIFEKDDFLNGGQFYNDGNGWWPIGTPLFWSDGYAFSGVFDGNGFTVSGLYSGYSGSGQLASAVVGLFGANLGTIKNLGVENSEFQGFSQDRSSGDYTTVGGIAGLNVGTITNCYVKNTYIAGDVAGGIAGEMFNGTSSASVTDCYSGNNKFTMTPAFISTSFHIYGGIVGYLDSGTVNKTYGFNLVYSFIYEGTSYYPTAIGGIIGNKGASATVSNSYYLATIAGGIYNPPGDTGAVKLNSTQMTSLASFPAFSSATWYIDPDDIYGYPQLTSFKRIKRTLFVSGMPVKSTYAIGESLDLTGAQLTMVQPDGLFEVITMTDKSIVYDSPGDVMERGTIYIEGFSSETAGTKTLRLSYSDMVTNFEVYVVEDQPGQQKASAPTANPPSGTVQSGTSVALTTGTAGASIRYTTNGSTPSSSSQLYTTPIQVTANVTIKAIACKAGMTDSAVSTFTYTVQEEEDGIVIADPALEEHIRWKLDKPTGAITKEDALSLTVLSVSNVKTLSGVEHFTNLKTLWLSFSQISDLAPIAGLTKLTSLDLYNCNVSDISQLAGLTELMTLDLRNNQISDLAPLAGLKSLLLLHLDNNQISDITPLTTVLPGMSLLKLQNNYISDISIFAGISPSTLDLSDNYLDITPGSATMQIIDDIIARTAYGIITYLPQKSPVEIVSAPTANPSGGTVESGTRVILSSSTDGAAIYYTTDGSTPNSSSLLYTAPIQITADVTIKAIACKTDMTDSAVSTFTYTVQKDDDIIIIEDPLLEAEMRWWIDKPVGAITKEDALNIDYIYFDNNDVESLNGLEHFSNLYFLSLNNCQVSDISPLSGLTKLTTLRLNNNQISDITPIAGLTGLNEIKLRGNRISDINVLTGLTNLTLIDLSNNYLDTAPGSATMQIIDDIIARTTYGTITYLPQKSPVEIVSAPTANPSGGTVESGTRVILSASTDGAAIYYTTDGSTPTASSAVYAAPITIASDMTIKAIAIKSGMANSAVGIFTYMISAEPDPGDGTPLAIDGNTWHIPADSNEDFSLFIKGWIVENVFGDFGTGSFDWKEGRADITVGSDSGPFSVIAKLTGGGKTRYAGIEKPVSVTAGEFDDVTWKIPHEFTGEAVIAFDGWTVDYVLTSVDYDVLTKESTSIKVDAESGSFNAIAKLTSASKKVKLICIERE